MNFKTETKSITEIKALYLGLELILTTSGTDPLSYEEVLTLCRDRVREISQFNTNSYTVEILQPSALDMHYEDNLIDHLKSTKKIIVSDETASVLKSRFNGDRGMSLDRDPSSWSSRENLFEALALIEAAFAKEEVKIKMNETFLA
jgi:hypothetical protein